MAATVVRRFPDEPPGFVARNAAPVDGIGWASPVVLAACTAYGYRARPAFESWSPLPLYSGSGRTTLAKQQNGGTAPDFVTAPVRQHVHLRGCALSVPHIDVGSLPVGSGPGRRRPRRRV